MSDSASAVADLPSPSDYPDTLISSCNRPVVIRIEVANATHHHLMVHSCYVAWGQLKVPQSNISPMSKEAMLGHTTGFYATGSTGVAAWKIMNTDMFFVVMWSGPWNFNHHSNVLAIGFRDNKCEINQNTYEEMYYHQQDATWFVRGEFYCEMPALIHEDRDKRFKVTGTMGNGHKCEAKINLLPGSNYGGLPRPISQEDAAEGEEAHENNYCDN